MRTRLMLILVGGLIGVIACVPVSQIFNINIVVSVLSCVLAGATLGYLASVMSDVFGTALPTDE
jgi:hypothetical protein